MFALNVVRSSGCGKKTAASGTAITELIRPRRGTIPYLSRLLYTAGATAHVLTVMKAQGTTNLSAAAAASQAVINLNADPGTGTTAGAIAANDYVVIEKPDGGYHMGVVSSVSELAVTLTSNVPAGGFAANAKVWFLGAAGDGHPQYDLASGGQTVLSDDIGGVMTGDAVYTPLVLYVNNATNAGVLDRASYGWYIDPGLSGPFAAPLAEGEGQELREGETGTLDVADDPGFEPACSGVTPHHADPYCVAVEDGGEEPPESDAAVGPAAAPKKSAAGPTAKGGAAVKSPPPKKK